MEERRSGGSRGDRVPGAMDLDGPSQGPASGGRAKQLVVLLHGWGANGDDLIGLAPYFAQGLPDTHFVSPNAPFPCEANPAGLQWFSLMDRSQSEMLAGLRLAASLVESFLADQQEALGLTNAQTALVGFSQGTMLSLHLAPRLAQPLAAVVGFSGALVGAELLAEELRSKPPVLLVHGEADPVVPPQASQAAAEALRAQGLECGLLLRPGLPHSIDPAGIQQGLALLRKGFGLE